MNLDAVLAYIIAIMLGLGVFAVIMGFFANNKKLIREQEIENLIAGITKTEVETERRDSNLPKEKSWFAYWYKLGLGAGIEQTSPNKMGIIAMSIGLGAWFLGTFAYPRDIMIGTLMGAAGIVVFRIYLNHQSSSRLAKIDKQLPALLAGMRANLSANMTPQQAILSQVGEIPAPLGEELMSLKADLDLNIPLDNALANFAQRIPSRELGFLVSSMRIAISQGANLDDLLKTLQGILVQRASIRDKLATAVAQAQPAIYVTAIAIPGGLIFSYMSNTDNKAFWFSFPGLLAFGFIAFCYVAGLFAASKQIQKVKDA